MFDSMRVVQQGAYYIQLTCDYHELFEYYNICVHVYVWVGVRALILALCRCLKIARIHYPGKLKAGLWVY